jgi:hypothetical protein
MSQDPQHFRYPPIYPGFEWNATIALKTKSPFFPEGCRLRADIRANPNSPIIGSLTTENGGLRRIDDERIAITIPAETTALITATRVIFDPIRTDIVRHLGFRVTIPVEKSGTAPHA